MYNILNDLYTSIIMATKTTATTKQTAINNTNTTHMKGIHSEFVKFYCHNNTQQIHSNNKG